MHLGNKMKESGIYAITGPNDKVYIGSSINVHKRWTIHKNQLRNNKHHSAHLQRAWNKYGEDAFEFSMLEYITDKTLLINREQFYLDTIISEKRYNISPTAGSSLGIKRTADFKQKVSQRRKGSKHTNESRALMRISQKGNNKGKKHPKLSEYNKSVKAKTYQMLNPQGDVVTFTNMREFCRNTGLNRRTLLRVLKGDNARYQSIKGWRRYEG